jgi:membrane protein YqaA with SNARE-associated domain
MTGPRAYAAAIVIGLLEAVIPFITPEVFLIPMLAAERKRMWVLALCPVIGNVLAALILYTVGAMMAEPVVEPLVSWMGAEAEYKRAIDWLREDGFLAIFLLDLVPIPVQVVLLAAGVAGFSLPLFLIAIALSRAIRYLIIAGIVALVGKRARTWLEEHQLEIFLVGLALSAALAVWMFIG